VLLRSVLDLLRSPLMAPIADIEASASCIPLADRTLLSVEVYSGIIDAHVRLRAGTTLADDEALVVEFVYDLGLGVVAGVNRHHTASPSGCGRLSFIAGHT
jgi:hypothetical protein